MINARELALKVLYKIEVEESFANIALRNILNNYKIEDRDKGLLTELVYGVVKMNNTLEWILLNFIDKKRYKKLTPWIKLILKLGIYQLKYLDKIPESAAVNESVKLARKYGHEGTSRLVNGVLRNYLRKKDELTFPDLKSDPLSHISLKYAHPEWLVETWLREYGLENTIKLCEYNNKAVKTSIRVNTLKTSKEVLSANLKEKNIGVKISPEVPEALTISDFPILEEIEEFRQGHFLVQDIGSMLISHVLNPIKHSLIIDACAAPGSKTTHLAQLVGNEGEIIACDIYEHKLNLIEDNAKKLGITIIKTKKLDAREIGSKYQGQADYLLIDAPCSGLGVLGRRPDARWKKSKDTIMELSTLQKEILLGACDSLKNNGVLVYSTCTIAKEENIDVVEYFLRKRPDFQLESIVPYLPFQLREERDIKQAEKGYIQFLPHEHGIDGFFMARFIRKLECAKPLA